MRPRITRLHTCKNLLARLTYILTPYGCKFLKATDIDAFG